MIAQATAPAPAPALALAPAPEPSANGVVASTHTPARVQSYSAQLPDMTARIPPTASNRLSRCRLAASQRAFSGLCQYWPGVAIQATSGGAVNIVTGESAGLLRVLAEHADLDAIWCFADETSCATAKALSIGNLMQVFTNEGRAIDWFNGEQGEGRWREFHAQAPTLNFHLSFVIWSVFRREQNPSAFTPYEMRS